MNICQVHEIFLCSLFYLGFFINLFVFFFTLSNIKTSLTLHPVHRECTKKAKALRNQTTMINQRRQVYQDPQTSLFSNFFIKMGPTGLFTLLKIILLQCFQFSAFCQRYILDILAQCNRPKPKPNPACTSSCQRYILDILAQCNRPKPKPNPTCTSSLGFSRLYIFMLWLIVTQVIVLHSYT